MTIDITLANMGCSMKNLDNMINPLVGMTIDD
jgi:hypothetical protein